MKLDNLRKYLDSLGKEVVAGARAKLRAAGKGGGALDKSLNFDIVEDGKFIDIQWKMLPYGEFVDKGVKGAGGEIKSGKYEGSWGVVGITKLGKEIERIVRINLEVVKVGVAYIVV
tara:strand:+ start:470 stop:817 length:348 start_codon:yes stop_codon:yes gene_type:complete